MGGIIDMATGVGEMVLGMENSQAEQKANSAQLSRERRRADVAVQGAIEKGSYASGKQRILNAQLAGKQKQAYTQAGVDATQGTAAAVQADTAALGEHDAQMLAINAAREAWGYKLEREQSEEEYWRRASNIGKKEAGALLGGASKYASGMVSMGGKK